MSRDTANGRGSIMMTSRASVMNGESSVAVIYSTPNDWVAIELADFATGYFTGMAVCHGQVSSVGGD